MLVSQHVRYRVEDCTDLAFAPAAADDEVVCYEGNVAQIQHNDVARLSIRRDFGNLLSDVECLQTVQLRWRNFNHSTLFCHTGFETEPILWHGRIAVCEDCRA